MTASAAPPSIGDLFARVPVQFGMRGDPHLWRELQLEFADTALPGDWFELRRLVQAAVERRVGRPLSEYADPPSVHIPEFDPGHGMSAGHVHLVWWARTGIPILLDRFEALRSNPEAAAG